LGVGTGLGVGAGFGSEGDLKNSHFVFHQSAPTHTHHFILSEKFSRFEITVTFVNFEIYLLTKSKADFHKNFVSLFGINNIFLIF